MDYIISILTPTIPKRHKKFCKLYAEINRQITYMNTYHPSLGMIEREFCYGPTFLDGGLSIGKKREHLVGNARGKYLCFLDDDEYISPNYIETLVRLCIQDKDVCTFRSISKLDNYWAIVNMSLDNKENEQLTPDKIVNRPAWHVCPVKSEYAKLYPFEDINYGEDWDWFSKVLTHCETEAHSDAVIHQYNHSKLTSESDKITNYVQSESRRESNT